MQQYIEFLTNHPLLFGLLVVVLGAIFYTEWSRATRKYKVLGPSEAVRVMNQDDGLVLDVREEAEVRKTGRISGARHIPLGKLADRLSEIAKFKEKPVVVYCQSGPRSASACNILVKNGFSQVVNLQGGITAWSSASLPLSKK